MPPADGQVLLVGVDGGASEVKAHEVIVLSDDGAPTLVLGPAAASVCYEQLAGFAPRPMAEQLAELQHARLDAAERAQGELWVAGAANAIASVASQAGAARVLVGICMPGLKRADGRGIVAMKNGPRMPDFLAELEAALAREGVELARATPPLASDGDACALGEECDAQGALRGVANAYCLGGGTGVSEAFKLAGELVGLDMLAPHVSKAWQMESRQGPGFEELLSARGLNARYSARSGANVPGDRGEYPETLAKAGDVIARAVLGDAALALAELVFERLVSLRQVRRASPLLDRVVVGQRLGQLLDDPALAPYLRDPFEAELARAIETEGGAALRAHYLDGAALRADFVHASKLRAAPALGAAALAIGARGARLANGAGA